MQPRAWTWCEWCVRMKLSVLFLLVLLALSSASLQDIVKISSQHKNVSISNQGPEDRIPEIISNRTMLKHRRPKRHAQPPPLHYNSANLKWVTWNGSLPNSSVSFVNKYAGRIDYVCKYKCEAGFYNPDMGSYCYYPYGNAELRNNTFEILVNKDNFEILEWKDGSYGLVPEHSVRTCSSGDIYVGKNKYGLGKVDVKNEAFFLPWEGYEYFYKSYQVLTYKVDVYSEHMYNVKYNTNGAEIIQYPPETMRISAITNYQCSSVMKTATLSVTNRLEKMWNIGSSIMFGIKKTFTGGVPGVASGSIEIGSEVSFQFSGGHTVTEESSHSISVEITVPPNHYCRALMVGHKYKANIPFTAHLSRTYRNGDTTWTLISGTYDSTQIGEVQAVVERCEPAHDAKPCTQKKLR
ncbi:natterin-3-like [Siniperca chuatsi]|uniref:natterin-3-like n=1 Tax=Siniperca chuatsi TaxID=119488 RepID=UPI001CE19798|nr:natterin-3-like [Siniperca chuatsi]